MVPTLRSGDALVARRNAPIEPGDLVIARYPDRPDIGLVVKRVSHKSAQYWWVLSDNEYAGGDSRSHGPAVVEARVIFRYWPRPRLFRRPRTRIRT
jgi:SOS-response transcriptional repressor LexA